MKTWLFILGMAGLALRAGAAPSPAPPPDYPQVDSTWPGVKMMVMEVERIPDNRVVMLIRIQATNSAPPYTLIGTPLVIPPNTRKEDRDNYQAGAYSLDGSTITDEQTQVKYASVAPNPKGPTFRSSTTLETLAPGAATLLCIEFPAPPLPMPDNEGHIPKQTVSVLLPRAKGPITKVVIPPPTPATPR